PVIGKRNKRGGIWHSGGGPAIDERGDFLYVVTGNGESCNDQAGVDFDSSDVKLDLELGVVDYFTPSFQNFLNGCDGERRDLDLSVSGPMVPPEWVDKQRRPVGRILHGSKQGIIYN